MTPDPLAASSRGATRGGARVERATLRYYLDRAYADVGSPMPSALYGGLGLLARRDRGLAAELFDEGDPRLRHAVPNTHEYRHRSLPGKGPDGRPVRRELAGFLLACLYGLTGLADRAECARRARNGSRATCGVGRHRGRTGTGLRRRPGPPHRGSRRPIRAHRRRTASMSEPFASPEPASPNLVVVGVVQLGLRQAAAGPAGSQPAFVRSPSSSPSFGGRGSSAVLIVGAHQLPFGRQQRVTGSGREETDVAPLRDQAGLARLVPGRATRWGRRRPARARCRPPRGRAPSPTRPGRRRDPWPAPARSRRVSFAICLPCSTASWPVSLTWSFTSSATGPTRSSSTRVEGRSRPTIRPTPTPASATPSAFSRATSPTPLGGGRPVVRRRPRLRRSRR